MKKIISTVFIIAMLSLAVFADGSNPNSPTCGHINTPVFVCEPPPPQPRDTEDKTPPTSSDDESTISIIKAFIAECNPFGYFLN